MPGIIRDLGDGLVLRRATRKDADALAQFNGTIHRNNDTSPINAGICALVQDMAARPHPAMSEGDFTIVEDTRTRRIVSSLCLINQTWTYAGIPFGVGRPELVGTNPDYRNRGLVRAQFEEIHRWSEQRGHLLQGITGIPYYYRQYGYTYALSLGGGRTGAAFDVPALKEGTIEPFLVRPARSDDLTFLCEIYAAACKRSLVACVRDAASWQYELHGRQPESDAFLMVEIIETHDKTRAGYLCRWPRLRNGGMGVDQLELAPDISWVAAAPSILRYLKACGEQETTIGKPGAFSHLSFWLGAEHPFYQVAQRRLPNIIPPYAWYVRVPDIAVFLERIAPVLEQRMASSLAPGYSGEVKLNFYRSGISMSWENGRLVKVGNWQPRQSDWGPGRFPNLTFLELLFGFRTLEELQDAYPDCTGGNDENRVLLQALFPKLPTNIWPIE